MTMVPTTAEFVSTGDSDSDFAGTWRNCKQFKTYQAGMFWPAVVGTVGEFFLEGSPLETEPTNGNDIVTFAGADIGWWIDGALAVVNPTIGDVAGNALIVVLNPMRWHRIRYNNTAGGQAGAIGVRELLRGI